MLIALLIYFAFRTELEWRYCSPAKQYLKIARVDYWSTHGLAVMALGLFALQRLAEVQVVQTVLEGHGETTFGTAAGVVLGSIFFPLLSG